MPQTYLFLSDDQEIVGVTREESEHGFSASFDYPLPLEEGDIVDARVGYRRIWVEVIWKRNIMEKKTIAGFRFRSERNPPGD